MRYHAGCVREGTNIQIRCLSFAACHSTPQTHINCRWELRHSAAAAHYDSSISSALLPPLVPSRCLLGSQGRAARRS
jgi:hypothetical protein